MFNFGLLFAIIYAKKKLCVCVYVWLIQNVLCGVVELYSVERKLGIDIQNTTMRRLNISPLNKSNHLQKRITKCQLKF